MTGLAIGIIIAYLLACIAVGLLAQRRISRSDEGGAQYYLAGRTVSTWVNTLAILSAVGSGGTFLASIGTIWNVGLAWYAWAMGGAIAGFTVASIVVARTYRSTRRTTVASYLALRYPSSKILLIGVPIVLVVGSAMYLISQMSAGGHIAAYVTGLSFEWSLVIIATVFVLYTSMGGMLAVTWTNVLQGAMVVLITIVLMVCAIALMPAGWGDFISATTAENPTFGTAGDGTARLTYVGAFVTWAAAICVTPHIIMRAFTAKSVRSGIISMNASMMIFGLMLLVLGLLVAPYVGELSEASREGAASDMWMLLIVEHLVPAVFLGLIVAAILAAIMSTVDALLLAVSSSIGHDLYQVLAKGSTNQKRSVRISRIASWVVGVVCVLLTLNPPPLLMVFYTAAIGLFVSCLFVPVVAGMWWKHANPAGAASGFLGGVLVFGFCFTALDMPSNSEVLIALPASLIATVVVSLATGGEKGDRAALEREKGLENTTVA